MGWNNPPIPWSEMERRLSGRPSPAPAGQEHDGGDSPAWTRHRGPYQPPAELIRTPSRVPYAELHCHSHFSFLDGASSPAELVEEAVRLGLAALAITDHDGFYGAVRFKEAARCLDMPTVYGAELSLGLPAGASQAGRADPDGTHVLILARNPDGYRRLCRVISDAQLAGKEKGRPVYDLARLAGTGGGDWLWLTGCRKGTVPAALAARGPAAARAELHRLVELAGGREHVGVELWNHGDPTDSTRNDALVAIAEAVGVECVATNNVHYHAPARRRLATAMAAVRARRSLDELEGWLPAAATAHLRSGDEQDWWFRRYPGVVERAAEWGTACAFDLSLVAPDLPHYDCPDGFDETGYLRRLVREGTAKRYKDRSAQAQPRLEHELGIIESLGWPGYFLLVWDIVRFCNRKSILVQGRGSAVGSAVCYVLGITSIDPIAQNLLFERFLSEVRGKDEPPDIDLDIESGRREEVIQYVYGSYGRDRAAQVANVITYRSRSAVRDVAKALGYSPGQQDAWSKQLERGRVGVTAGLPPGAHTIPPAVLELAGELEDAPRHLGIHSGGMVLADRPIAEVCPVEWARHTDRTVLQWDKDDCENAKLVKFDLLGLGMLSAIHLTLDLVAAHHGKNLLLHTIPTEDSEVYDMLCAADAIGVFQVESRAQMQTLPRLRPRNLYDLAVEVAIIRPGPIQGGSVHPYLRRRAEEEAPTCHPRLAKILERTLGIPLFQEQLMEIARELGGFSPAEADELRRAMSAKRSEERMEQLRGRLFAGMAQRGVADREAKEIWTKLTAFSGYGFPESHALAFAHLAYVSAWLKRWYPAAFCAGLLGAQPMGFYSPHSLVADARRHGVEVRTPDLNASGIAATLENEGKIAPPAPGRACPETWGSGGPAVRLGLSAVRTIGTDLATAVVAERGAGGDYRSMEDLARRVPALTLAHLEALATAGAFGCLRLDRRSALWAAGAIAQGHPGQLEGAVTGVAAPSLPPMTERQVAHADLWATSISPGGHPTRFIRAALDARGVIPAERLAKATPDSRVLVAGVVTHRQRPATAGGITFLNLEDETGMINVICSPKCWARYRPVVSAAPALLIQGTLQNAKGVVNIIAEGIERLPLTAPTPSRDFR